MIQFKVFDMIACETEDGPYLGVVEDWFGSSSPKVNGAIGVMKGLDGKTFWIRKNQIYRYATEMEKMLYF
jgi:hypothetical protein